MSAFTNSITNSAEFQGVENSIKKGFLPQGVLGLTPVQKAHIISALVGGLKISGGTVYETDASALATTMSIRLSSIRLKTLIRFCSYS